MGYDYDPTEEEEGTYADSDDFVLNRCEVFAEPGGRSALRAASGSNPRNLPCPTCGMENVLTPCDVEMGYQCDCCADAAEGRGP